MNDIKYGLVLSGGGVKGIAHIGVIKALEEHGIKPEIISGASAGAIIGAFYAAGYSIEDMLDFWRQNTPFTVHNYTYRKAGVFDTENLQELFQHYFPKNSFEALDKKLHIATTNMITGETRFFDQGELIIPILASAAVPGVFSPLKIEDGLYADGGITNNFPTEPLLSNCDRIIGVYLSPLQKVEIKDLNSTVSVVERAYTISRASISIQKFESCEIVVCPDDLYQFGSFNREHIDEIFKIGYEAALKELELFASIT